jgi:hypothetical protein
LYVPEFHRDGTAGGYLRRLSCRLCIFSTDTDLLAIRQHDSEAFHAVSELEQKIGFTMRSTKSLVQITGTAQSVIDARDARCVSLFDPFLFAFLSLGPSTISHLNAAFRQSRPLAFGN